MDLKAELPKPSGISIIKAAQAGINPEKFFKKCAKKSGDLFCISLPGTGKIYFTGTAEGAKDIFSASPDTFVPLTPNPIEPILGPKSLILLGGEEHKRERKLLNPPFHGERMEAYGRIIQEITLQQMEKFQAGQNINVEETMKAISLEVIIRSVFGITEPELIKKFTDAIISFSSGFSMWLFMFPFLRKQFLGISAWDKFIQAKKEFNNLLSQEIIKRKQEKVNYREDILSLLLEIKYDDGSELGADELNDELRTLLVAGHETTSTGLTWALSYLSYLPEVKEKLLTELNDLGQKPSPEQLTQLPYLDAICKEALRIHPVVPIVFRKVVKPFSFRGHHIPVGKNVAVCISLLHQDETIWDQPLEFIPERFIQKKYSPFEYAPFGGGARRCIGAAFAHYEMKIILGTLMSIGKFGELKKEPSPPKVKGITSSLRETVLIKYLGREI